MRVTIEFGAYNPRRYGKPWMAKVTSWNVGRSPTLEFGATVGLTTEIDAEPGALVRWGQKDYRGGHSERAWGIVLSDGTVANSTVEKCRAHWLAGCPVLDSVEG